MPTRNPRVNVCVTSEQHTLLLELGKLQGRSAASFLREMLDSTMPVLIAMLPVYRAAAAQQAMQPEALQLAIRDAIAAVDAGRDQLDFLHHLAHVSSAISNDQGEEAAPAPSEAREDAAPRPAARKRS